METLGNGQALVELLRESAALLDARLTDLRVWEVGGVLQACLRFEPRKGTFNGTLELLVRGLQRVDFCYDSDSAYYYVERYKLVALGGNGVALSLDPLDETDALTGDDRAVFVGNEFSGRLIT